jgi:putative endonuclease
MKTKNKNYSRIETGKWGEDIALEFLLKKGFDLVERNFRSPDGEIDLIVKKGLDLVFVEVKTRRSLEYGSPEEAVDSEKIDHIEAAAGWYLQQNPEYEENWHLDVISVMGSPGKTSPEIHWFENVIAA